MVMVGPVQQRPVVPNDQVTRAPGMVVDDARVERDAKQRRQVRAALLDGEVLEPAGEAGVDEQGWSRGLGVDADDRMRRLGEPWGAAELSGPGGVHGA